MVAFAKAKSRRPLTADQRALFDRHIRLAYCAVNQILPKLPAWIEREDLEQAAMIGLMEACRGFNPGLGFKFSTYALRICYRHAVRHLKRNQRRERVWGQSPEGRPSDVAAERSPFDTLEAAEAWAALDGLHPRDRFVVVQRLSGQKIREIAELIGVTHQRVHQIHCRAMGRLRERLEAVAQ